MQRKDVPYTVNLDQERAKQLVRQGGTLLLLNVPEGTVVGLDQQVCKPECPFWCTTVSTFTQLLL